MAAAERIDPELVLYRPFDPAQYKTDAPFVFKTWMQWARANAPSLKHLPNRVFWSDLHGYRAHVEALVKRSRVLIACDPECPEMIFGFAVAEPPRMLHFVFVTRDMRRAAGGMLSVGIGGSLVRLLLPAWGREEHVATLDRPAMPVWAQRHKVRFDPVAVPLVGDWFKQWARDAWRSRMEE